MTGLVLATLLLAPPTASVPTQVEIQDPVEDSGFSPTDAPAPDLRSVAARISPSGELILRARFAPGTFDVASTYVQFSLQLGNTGSTVGPCAQCGNYLVDFNGIGKPSRSAKVQRLDSAGRYEVAGTVPVVVAADQIRVTVPHALLPRDLCRVEFRVVAGVRRGDDALSIILDRAPDSGAHLAFSKWRRAAEQGDEADEAGASDGASQLIPGVRRTEGAREMVAQTARRPKTNAHVSTAFGCEGCAKLSETSPHPPQDRDGRHLRAGDTVRVVGAPNLAGMGTKTRAESKPVFDHLVGQYKRITEFDEFGEARLHFRIMRGRHRGSHSVWIEPCLLKKWSRRRRTTG